MDRFVSRGTVGCSWLRALVGRRRSACALALRARPAGPALPTEERRCAAGTLGASRRRSRCRKTIAGASCGLQVEDGRRLCRRVVRVRGGANDRSRTRQPAGRHPVGAGRVYGGTTRAPWLFPLPSSTSPCLRYRARRGTSVVPCSTSPSAGLAMSTRWAWRSPRSSTTLSSTPIATGQRTSALATSACGVAWRPSFRDRGARPGHGRARTARQPGCRPWAGHGRGRCRAGRDQERRA